MTDSIQTTEPTNSTDASVNEEAPRAQPVAKGWTMGNSANLVEGAEREPRWVSIAWFVVPGGMALAMLAIMAHLFGS